MMNSQQQSSVNQNLVAFRKHLAQIVAEEKLISMIMSLSPDQQEEVLRNLQTAESSN